MVSPSRFGMTCVLTLLPSSPCRSSKAHDNRLAAAARPRNPSLAHVLVHVLRQAADESLVGLDRAAHLLLERAGLHGDADSVHHKPSGLLRDADGAVNLIGTDAVLAVRE